MSGPEPERSDLAGFLVPRRSTVGELVKALALAQLQMEQPKKSQTAQVHSDKANYSYTYADLADIAAAALPALNEQGIAVTQDPKVDREGAFVTITTTLRLGEESLTFGPLSLPIGKRDAQGVGSAITYARRYQLAAAVGIAAERDDDGAAAMPAYDEGPYGGAPRPERAPKPPKAAAPRRIKATRVEAIRELAERKGVSSKELLDWAGRHGFETLEELDTPSSNDLLRMLNTFVDAPDDAGSTMDDGGTTAAASSVGTRNDAASAESAGDRSDAVEGGGVVAGAPGSDDGGEA